MSLNREEKDFLTQLGMEILESNKAMMEQVVKHHNDNEQRVATIMKYVTDEIHKIKTELHTNDFRSMGQIDKASGEMLAAIKRVEKRTFLGSLAALLKKFKNGKEKKP